jgi:methionyl-tRNA formyltransferase
MRIVFLGEDSFSAIVLESLINAGHTIAGAFCPEYPNNIYSRLALLCKNKDVPFERIGDISGDDFYTKLQEINPELIVVCHFQKLIKQRIIDLPPKGCINLHPSLLPMYRGMAPQHWPIINGEKKTGITVHYIDNGIDTGDIILQQEIEINPKENVYELQHKFKAIYSVIVKEAIAKIELGDNTVVKQSHLPGSYYGKLKKADCVIDLNGSVIDAYNLIRGVTFPYFGARTGNYIIWKASLNVVTQEGLEPAAQGMIMMNEKLEFIKFHDGILKVDKYEKL